MSKRSNSKKEEVSFQNDYEGCITLPETLEVIDPTKISPKEFFDRFISLRKPVIFDGVLNDPEWKVSKETWNHDYLKSKVPKSCKVKVEFRENTSESFGRGQEITMKFEEFLNKIDEKTESFYMTTQEIEYNTDGSPKLLTKPLNYLQSDFPIIPSFFSTLIPSSINLWYGQTKVETTSGLHHDYHDNLYIMLKGQKTITLISPHYANCLYTEGSLLKIHKNGRINYQNEPTEADGRNKQAEKAFEASLLLEQATKKLKEAEDENVEDMNELNEIEDDIDRALEAVLDAEVDDEDDFNGEDDFENGEDFEDEDFEDDEEEDDEKDDNDEEDDDEEAIDFDALIQASSNDEKKKKNQRPNNFSKINTKLDNDELKKSFPLFLDAKKDAREVILKEGQMLYIPSGWFHEVKSLGGDGHMAFNYWFHPPDSNDFNKPYSCDFWKKSFAKYS